MENIMVITSSLYSDGMRDVISRRGTSRDDVPGRVHGC